MTDHVQEAIQAAHAAHAAAQARVVQVITETIDQLTSRLGPYSSLSADELTSLVTAGVEHAAGGVMEASNQIWDAMVEALNSLQARTEARDLPDTPPPDWTL